MPPDIRDDSYQEERLRLRLQQINNGHKQSMHIILHGGRKITRQTIVLVRPKSSEKYSREGAVKQQWLLKLPRNGGAIPWGPEGEEGDQYGKSVLSELDCEPADQ